MCGATSCASGWTLCRSISRRSALWPSAPGSLSCSTTSGCRLQPGESPRMRQVRFRTLGCWPLTAAIPSTATDIESVVAETLAARSSERQGRLIDHDQAGAMERKKQEGYF